MVAHVNQSIDSTQLLCTPTKKTGKPDETFKSVLENVGQDVKKEAELQGENLNAETADLKTETAKPENKSESTETDDITTAQTLGLAEAAALAAQSIPQADVSEISVTPMEFAAVEVSVADMQTAPESEVQASSLVQTGEVSITETAAPETEQSFTAVAENTASFETAKTAQNEIALENGSRADSTETLKVSESEVTASQQAESKTAVTRETVNAEAMSGIAGTYSKDDSAESNSQTAALSESDDAISLVASFTQPEVQNANAQATDRVSTAGGLESSVTTQVVNLISENLSDVSAFKNEFSFTLNPENLGKVAVRMIVENGTLTVELSASSKETQSILASNLESIKEILRSISIENQVNQSAQDANQDYLQQHSESENGADSYRENSGHSADTDNGEVQFTEDFLSMLDILSAEDI